MDANFRSFFQSTVRFFTRPNFPPIEPDQIAVLERQIEDTSDQQRGGIIQSLSWSRLHSWKEEIVRREIDMLEICHGNDRRILQEHRRLYHLAVGYFKLGYYAKSRQLVEKCLQIEPGCSEALSLQTAIENNALMFGVLGFGFFAAAAVLIVGSISSIAATLARKN